MKTFLIVLLSTFPIVSMAQSDESEEPSFKYEIVNHIGDKTGYFNVELDPLVFTIRGSYLGLGAGIGLKFSNINEKYSFETHFDYMYGNYTLDKNLLGYESFDFEWKKPMNIDGTFGYTVKQDRELRDIRVRLKKSGNTEFVGDLPCKVVTSYIARLGYAYSSFFTKGEVNNEDYQLNNPRNTYALFQNTQNISIGFLRKISINSTFKTDKFGVVKESTDSEVYADVLINFSNPFPQVKEMYYLNEFYPNEVSHRVTASYTDQNFFRESFYRIPAGLRVGWRGNSLKKSGVIAKVELGMFPGSYTAIMQSVALKLGVSYRFQHNF